jgi:pectate lyase
MICKRWGIAVCAALIAWLPSVSIAQLPAFPSAEGFGAQATGGRGGDVYRVTTLSDAGAGSFRDAVSKPHRIVVFDVGGVIKLKSELAFSSNITVAGQSAPGEGICLYGEGASLSGQKNVIVRYMRLREGINGGKKKCSLNVAGGHDIILDHCSIEWGRWDCIGLTDASSDITLQYCIIGEGVDPQRFGSIIDSATNVTLSHNLWIHNQSRNPKSKGTIQYINNVVYDWGVTGLAGGHSGAKHQLDAINNYLIKGPSSDNHAIAEFTATDEVYQSGNLVDLNRDGTLSGQPVEEKDFGDSKGAPTFKPQPSLSPPIAVTVDSATDAYQKVIAQAGASLHRDAVDQRLIDDVRSLGTKGAISKSEADVGGQGELHGGTVPKSTAGDGIPDEWKNAHHLNINDAQLYKATAMGSSGYTTLEVYLNSLTAPQR